MSYTDLLIDSCTVQVFTDGAQDAYGNPAKTWTSTSQACRLMHTTGVELKIGAEVVIADYKLFLGDVTITEQSRVEVSSVDYEVLLVSDRQNGVGSHHKECLMRTVR